MQDDKPFKRKSRMVSMRMTEEQFEMVDRLAREIRRSTGFRITKASIMLKLMEYGLPKLKEELKDENK